jgi:hypothetical protein
MTPIEVSGTPAPSSCFTTLVTAAASAVLLALPPLWPLGPPAYEVAPLTLTRYSRSFEPGSRLRSKLANDFKAHDRTELSLRSLLTQSEKFGGPFRECSSTQPFAGGDLYTIHKRILAFFSRQMYPCEAPLFLQA